MHLVGFITKKSMVRDASILVKQLLKVCIVQIISLACNLYISIVGYENWNFYWALELCLVLFVATAALLTVPSSPGVDDTNEVN
jgi:hypothetical protein